MPIKIDYLKALIQDFLHRLRDVRFAGQVLFVIIVLLVSWSGVKVIKLNYDLQKQIATAKQENEVQKLENSNLALQNEYYNSKQYLDLQARLNFGLANSGEKEMIVPKSVALSYVSNVNVSSNEPSKIIIPSLQNNIQSWINFFLHRN